MNIKVHGSDCGLVGGIVLTFWSNWGNPQKNWRQCPSQDLNRSYVRIITTWFLQMFYIHVYRNQMPVINEHQSQ